MKQNKQDRAWELLDAIGEADEKFVEDADEAPKRKFTPLLFLKRHMPSPRITGMIAAGLVLAIALPVLAVLLPKGNNGIAPINSEETQSVGSDVSREESSAPVLSEDESTPPEVSDGSEGSESSGNVKPPQRPVVSPGFDLMAGVHASPVAAQKADDAFLQEQMRFSLSLFQQAAKEEQESGNSLLLSPLSAQFALSMAANGARGQTREEMRALLAGNLSMEQLNGYLHTLMGRLAKTGTGYKVNIANSIWYNDWVQIYEDFLQTNADYYGAGAYQLPFDEKAKTAINAWAEEQTDGLIREALSSVDPEAAMYLLNAILFDAEWRSIYHENEVCEGNFTAYNGGTQKVTFLHSSEYTYYKDSMATGFAKPYTGDKYAFVALLPNKGVDVYDYVASLTPEGLLRTLQNGTHAEVQTSLPKFSSAYASDLTELLSALGMESAFQPEMADFSGMITGFDGSGHLKNVNQKAVISVGELGTKAAAVTSVPGAPDTAGPDHKVYLNRPFVYLIVDTETNLPLFMGVQTEISGEVPEGQAPEIEDWDEEPYEPKPPVKEDYTGLTVSVSPVTEGAMALDITFENNRTKHFYYKSTDLLLQRKTENGYEDFPFIGKPKTYTFAPAGGVGHDHFRLERDFGVTFRAGEVYRLLLTNVEDEQLYCEFTVGEPTEGLRLSIWVEEPVKPSLKFLFFELRNEGALDFAYCYADVRLERLTDKGWETFSRIDDDVAIFSDMLVKAGAVSGGFVNPEQYGVTWQSGVTYRITLATVPGVYGEFTVE